MFAALVLAGCAAPSASSAPPSRAAGPAPYDVPPTARGGAPGVAAAVADPGQLPAKRETAAAAPAEDRTIYRVPVGSSPALGKATALVTIIEFADYQCPFCVRAEDTMRAVIARYGDDVRLVLKHEPLPFHKRAEPAAELAFEARAQKGEAAYWSVHRLLMGQRGQLTDDDLKEVAESAGLDADKALRNVTQRKHAAKIEEDNDLADDVGAGGTPTFFINGRKIVGAQPIERFVAVIDEQLAAARAVVAKGIAPAKVYDTLQQEAVTTEIDKVDVPAPTADNPSRGPANAKVVVQVFSDFQCPFCKRVEPTLADLEAAFPGQIRIVWRNHPLSFHAHARIAAEAALEAYAQKGAAGFWKMHGILMGNQSAMDREALEKYAVDLGLDLARFRRALDEGIHRAAIEADTKVALAAGLTGTPSFTINGYKITGAQPLIRFKKVVQRALSEAK
ncbi:Periplasmic thiol:disulfide interchange protein DsbA [Minicystis rosea]|nr:Periplasmic thiol:disulfide interchange protein DsbA [Minicystis rosea]